MTNGNVYQIVVFQAERQKTSSSYKLTLQRVHGATSVCGPTCGDRVVTAGEQCDNGTAMNTGRLQPVHGAVQAGPVLRRRHGRRHQRDLRQRPQRRRLRRRQRLRRRAASSPPAAATCWSRPNTARHATTARPATTARYGSAARRSASAPATAATARRRARRSSCDDGANDGTYGTCGDSVDAAAQLRPRAPLRRRHRAGRLRRAVRADGNQRSDLHVRLQASRHLRRRGRDARPSSATTARPMNNGDYGGCAPGCILAPHCGDAIKNGPEECDDGIRDNSYGGCSPAVQTARLLRRRHARDRLRTVRRRPEQRPDGRVFDRLQVQRPVAGVAAEQSPRRRARQAALAALCATPAAGIDGR